MNKWLWEMIITSWLSGASTALAFTVAMDEHWLSAFPYAAFAMFSGGLVRCIWEKHLHTDGSTER